MLDGLQITYDRFPNADDGFPPRVRIILMTGEEFVFNGVKVRANGTSIGSSAVSARHHDLPTIVIRHEDVQRIEIDDNTPDSEIFKRLK